MNFVAETSLQLNLENLSKVYRCFCFLVDVFELDRQFYLGTSDLGIRMNYILSLYMDSSNDANVGKDLKLRNFATRQIKTKIKF